MAGAVSYQLVHPTEASPAAVELVEAAIPGVAFKSVAPLIVATDAVDQLSMFDAVSDAAVLGATGAALLVIAAGVRRRAC